jgi:hypothetical protein
MLKLMKERMEARCNFLPQSETMTGTLQNLSGVFTKIQQLQPHARMYAKIVTEVMLSVIATSVDVTMSPQLRMTGVRLTMANHIYHLCGNTQLELSPCLLVDVCSILQRKF